MKKIAITLLLISYLGYSQTLVKTYYDPLFKTKLKEVYQVKNNTPTVNGYYKSYDEYGYLLVHRNYVNNKQNGKSTAYYGAAEALLGYGGENCLGKISGIYNYKNDKLDGLQTIYNYSEKGVRYLHKKETYSDGIMIHFIEYFPNNQEKKVIKTGKCFEYYENGVISAEYTVNENGELNGKYTAWYNSGKLELTGNFLDDKKNGEWIEYFENGEVKNKETYNLGNKLPNEKEKLEKQEKLIEEQEVLKKEKERLKIEENRLKEREKLREKQENEIKFLSKYNVLKNDFYMENQVVESNYKYWGGSSYKFKKEKLYYKYIEIIEFLDSNSEYKNIEEKIKYENIKFRLAKMMNSLINEETKKLEKELKELENKEDIINLILKQ